jgi:hypothetical protein
MLELQEMKIDLAGSSAYTGDDMFPFPQTAFSKEDVMAENEMDSQNVEEKDLEGVAGGVAGRIGACACDCEDGCCTDCDTTAT